MKPESFSTEKKVELKENEQAIFDVISERKSMDLNDLKEATGLSNKQWDKGIKALGKLGVTKVTKTDDSLIVDYVGE